MTGRRSEAAREQHAEHPWRSAISARRTRLFEQRAKIWLRIRLPSPSRRRQSGLRCLALGKRLDRPRRANRLHRRRRWAKRGQALMDQPGLRKRLPIHPRHRAPNSFGDGSMAFAFGPQQNDLTAHRQALVGGFLSAYEAARLTGPRTRTTIGVIRDCFLGRVLDKPILQKEFSFFNTSSSFQRLHQRAIAQGHLG